MHISHTKSFNTPVSIALATLAHMINVYEIYQYNKLSNIQYARFQILPVDLHFRLFWSAGIPPWVCLNMKVYEYRSLWLNVSTSGSGDQMRVLMIWRFLFRLWTVNDLFDLSYVTKTMKAIDRARTV